MLRKLAIMAAGVVLAMGASGALAGPVSVLDLTTEGAVGSINGAYFQQIDPQSTGTGVIDSFVRIQANGVEHGYNTDGALEYDQKAGAFTHDLLLSDVPVVQGDGLFRQFLLDVNQNSGGDSELLSLDSLEIYLSNTPGLTGYPFTGNATKIYDLDAAGDWYIKLDYSLNAGSGSGDMFAYIPDSLFTGPGTQYVYLYSKFGENYTANDGGEEWAVLKSTQAIPLPLAATQGLLALGGLGVVGAVRRFVRRAR